MSFQRRITLLSALAVAAAIVVVAATAWLIVRAELRGQIDDSLLDQADAARDVAAAEPFALEAPVPAGSLREAIRERIQGLGGLDDEGGGARGEAVPAPAPSVVPLGPGGPPGEAAPPRLPGLLGGPDLAQTQAAAFVVNSDGDVLVRRGLPADAPLPTSEAVAAIESDGSEPELTDATIAGDDVRLATVRVGDGSALVLARSLGETEDALSQLALIMALIAVGGTAVAAGLGALVARTALAPARELTSAAEEVARTEDLTRRIDVEGEDELARLGIAFNSMLAALESSVGAQRRLVADASHELRTPLTSLRTNIETLMRRPEMPDADREHLLRELGEEMEELGRLVDDIVDLAREGAETGAASQHVETRLDGVAAATLERARRRAPEGTTIEAHLEPALLDGSPERLDRAIGNLLDNALKWTPPGGTIALEADARGVRVEDSGPGISEGDAPYVFDRFWRAPSARGTPGSGLGLAIVKQVAATHGGTVAAGRSERLGGARLELALPAAAVPGDP